MPICSLLQLQRSTLRWTALILLPIIILLTRTRHIYSYSGEDAYHQRCLAYNATTNVTLYQSQRWIDSSCRPCCQPFPVSDASPEAHRPLHVVIVLTTPHLNREIIYIVAGLLSENINVTVFQVDFDRDMEYKFYDVLNEMVLEAVPCVQEQEDLQPTFSIQNINLPESTRNVCSPILNSTSSFMEPLQSCSVLMALSQSSALTNAFLGEEFGGDENDDDNECELMPPNVLLTDFHGFGAIFFAEYFGIPTVLLADETSFYKTIGRGTKQLSLWQSIRSIPNEILRSLWATKAFSDLNRVRALFPALQSPKRQLGGFWEGAAGIFVLANQYNSTTLPQQRNHFPPLMHLKTPILPPCFTCTGPDHPRALRQKNKPKNDANDVLVIVLAPDDFSGPQAREVLRGLSMARKSLQSYNDDVCRVAGGSNHENCFHDAPPGNLEVRWLVNMYASNAEYIAPNPVPDFVEIDDAYQFLDSILQSFQETKPHRWTILLARCDNGDANAALLLRVPTLCLPPTHGTQQQTKTTDNNRDTMRFLDTVASEALALQVVQFLWALEKIPEETRNIPHYDSSEGDSLQFVVAALRTAGSLYDYVEDDDGASLDPCELQQLFASVMKNKGLALAPHYRPQQPSFAYYTLYWTACIVLGLPIIFAVTRKRAFPAAATRILRIPSRTARHYRLFKVCSQVGEALVLRLSEVDTAGAAIAGFWNDRFRWRRPRDRNPGNTRQNNNHRSSGGKASNGTSHKKRMGKHR